MSGKIGRSFRPGRAILLEDPETGAVVELQRGDETFTGTVVTADPNAVVVQIGEGEQIHRVEVPLGLIEQLVTGLTADAAGEVPHCREVIDAGPNVLSPTVCEQEGCSASAAFRAGGGEMCYRHTLTGIPNVGDGVARDIEAAASPKELAEGCREYAGYGDSVPDVLADIDGVGPRTGGQVARAINEAMLVPHEE